jgi:hypothetical protein
VRWAGWSDESDSWEPAAHVLDQRLIAAFDASRAEREAAAEAARQAARAAADAARREAQAAERAERARYARVFIKGVRSALLELLRKRPHRAPSRGAWWRSRRARVDAVRAAGDGGRVSACRPVNVNVSWACGSRDVGRNVSQVSLSLMLALSSRHTGPATYCACGAARHAAHAHGIYLSCIHTRPLTGRAHSHVRVHQSQGCAHFFVCGSRINYTRLAYSPPLRSHANRARVLYIN